jgi:hypothetical protein
MFMHVPVELQDEFEETAWRSIEYRFKDSEGNFNAEAFSSFLRDYLMRHGAYVAGQDTFDAFQHHYSASSFNPFDLAKELDEAASWHQILTGGQADSNPEVEDSLADLRQLESSTTFSLLLNLYERRKIGEVTDGQLLEALQLLSGFIVRRLICGLNSRAYSRLFVQAIAALGEQPVEGLRRFLESHDHPETQRFIESFTRFNLYSSRYRKFILVALERAKPHKEKPDLSQAQVEHIMPQTLTDWWRSELGQDADHHHVTWLHTPGNLTLSAYNQELHNKPFHLKSQEYENSNIQMTRQLAEFTSWGPSEIEYRAREMARMAAVLWTGPDRLSPVRDERVQKNSGTRFEIRKRFWTGLSDYVRKGEYDLALKPPNSSNALRCGLIGTGVALYAYYSLKNKRLAVAAQFYGEKAKGLFQVLRERRDELEAEIGARVVWSIPAKSSYYREILVRNPVNPTEESLWPAYYEWLCRSLEDLRRVIEPKLPRKPRTEGDGKDQSTRDNLQFRIEYWTAFHDHLIESQSILKPRKPLPEPCAAFGVGRAGISLAAWMNRKDDWIAAMIIFHGPRARAAYTALEHNRASIESALGEQLESLKEVGKKHSKISLKREHCEVTNKDEWEKQHTWLQAKLEAFHFEIVPQLLAI